MSERYSSLEGRLILMNATGNTCGTLTAHRSFSLSYTYESVACETIIIPGRSSALLSKNGTSVGESDTARMCNAARCAHLGIYPLCVPACLPAILRMHPCRKRPVHRLQSGYWLHELHSL